MANIKYFSGTTEVSYPYPMRNAEFAAKFPGIKGLRSDSFARYVGQTADKQILPITRKIEYKANPSLHKCDARCLNATGKSCECACGGKNHGAGSFNCIAA
jgi:hypothetical protein